MMSKKVAKLIKTEPAEGVFARKDVIEEGVGLLEDVAKDKMNSIGSHLMHIEIKLKDKDYHVAKEHAEVLSDEANLLIKCLRVIEILRTLKNGKKD